MQSGALFPAAGSWRADIELLEVGEGSGLKPLLRPEKEEPGAGAVYVQSAGRAWVSGEYL